VPWWAAALGATALAATGAALGHFTAAIVTGCVLAALVADRTAFFTVLAQPPLIAAAVGATAVALGTPLLSAVVELSTAFPYLAATMVAVAAIVATRQLLARRPR
jgi:hypothetical protein